MMKKLACVVLCCVMIVGAVYPQETSLTAEDVTVFMFTNTFGEEEWAIEGQLLNTDAEQAYERIQIYADVLDEDGEVIGEAFGYLVNTCGFALIENALQPNASRTFRLSVDLYEDGVTPDSAEIFSEGNPITPEEVGEPLHEAVTMITDREIVSVQWRGEEMLYGEGCDEEIFTTYDWYEYTLETGESAALRRHPETVLITENFIRLTGITQIFGGGEDPALVDRSYITMSPYSRRVAYRDVYNNLYTTDEINPSDRLLIHTILHQYTLKGIQWTPEDNFVAYYFGAYGEPVRYITGGGRTRLISQVLTVNTPSNTVPTAQYDGQRVVISGTFNDVTGYYLQSTLSPQRDLLFEIAPEELAGNHYPAPAYYRKDIQNRYIYIIRPIDGVATLQCYHLEAKELHTLTPLPLQLATDERAWTNLSPDGTTLAIYAKGWHSGLWLVDLTAFGVCQ